MDEWKNAWDSCRGVFDELKVEGEEVVTDILNQENDLLDEIKERSQEEKAIKQLAKVVREAIWQSILNGKFYPESPKVSVTYEQVDKGVARFSEQEWIERLRNVCQIVAGNNKIRVSVDLVS